MSVVLPAPFGPMRAWRAPAWTSSDTPSMATKPRKLWRNPSVLRALDVVIRWPPSSRQPPRQPAMTALEAAHQPAGREQAP